VTVTDNTLSGGSTVIRAGASGNNTLDASGATASSGKSLTYVAGSGSDTFLGGAENDFIYVTANAVSGGNFAGGGGSNVFTLLTAGTFSLGGVKQFSPIMLAAGTNVVTVTDNTLSGGSTVIRAGASGNNTIDVSGATASSGKTLSYVAGSGSDTFIGGAETDLVYVTAEAVSGSHFTGGGGANVLTLTTAGTFSLDGVKQFTPIMLAAGNSTVTVTDNTLSGGPTVIRAAATGTNTIDASTATGSSGKSLTYVGASGKSTFIGGAENDTVYAGTGGDTIYAGTGLGTYTAGSGADSFMFLMASDSAFTPGSAAATDLINGFTAGVDKIDLSAILLNQKTVLDKGVIGAFTSTAVTDYFGTAGVAVEYGAGNKAQVYADANNNGSLDTGDMLIRLNGIAANSLGSSSFAV